MIEAMAFRTPVIAFNRGSVPEVIEDGPTGYLVEDETTRSAPFADCSACHVAIRMRFEERFMARPWPSIVWGHTRRKSVRPDRGPSIAISARMSLGHHHTYEHKAKGSDACQIHECCLAAESIVKIANDSRADRGANANGATNHSRASLKCPVPRDTSATVKGTNTPSTVAEIASRNCTATRSSGFTTSANNTPRMLNAPNARTRSGLRPHCCALRTNAWRKRGNDELRHDDARGDEDCRRLAGTQR